MAESSLEVPPGTEAWRGPAPEPITGVCITLIGVVLLQVLVLPEVVPGQRNEVGVAEACSGIRSLTGCLFAGSFLAAVFLEKLWKKTLLVGMAAVFAFGMNIVRALFLTGWAYRHGSDAIHNVHDIAGYAVLGLTVAGLLCLLPLLNLKISVHGRGGSRPPMPMSAPKPTTSGTH